MSSHTIMIYAMAAIAAVLIVVAFGLAVAHSRIVRRVAGLGEASPEEFTSPSRVAAAVTSTSLVVSTPV